VFLALIFVESVLVLLFLCRAHAHSQVMLEALVGFALELLRLWPLIYAKAAKRCWAVTAGALAVVLFCPTQNTTTTSLGSIDTIHDIFLVFHKDMEYTVFNTLFIHHLMN
jgi:hypothetical protein